MVINVSEANKHYQGTRNNFRSHKNRKSSTEEVMITEPLADDAYDRYESSETYGKYEPSSRYESSNRHDFSSRDDEENYYGRPKKNYINANRDKYLDKYNNRNQQYRDNSNYDVPGGHKPREFNGYNRKKDPNFRNEEFNSYNGNRHAKYQYKNREHTDYTKNDVGQSGSFKKMNRKTRSHLETGASNIHDARGPKKKSIKKYIDVLYGVHPVLMALRANKRSVEVVYVKQVMFKVNVKV